MGNNRFLFVDESKQQAGLKLLLAMLLAFSLCLCSASSAFAQGSPYGGPARFYISANGPRDGSADGLTWKTAWPDFDWVDWQTVQTVSFANKTGSFVRFADAPV